MKPKPTKTLQILLGVLAAFYLAGIIVSFIDGELTFYNLNDMIFLVLFIMFISGFVLSRARRKTAGILLMIWNAGIWIYDLCLNRGRQDSGMLSFMAVPALVIGALLLLQWYSTTDAKVPSEREQWKFILRILLINYIVLYGILVFTELTNDNPSDYFSLPFILFPLLLLLFLLGFVLSWKREFQAGLIFLLWYAIMLYGTIAYSEFRESGPWILFGFPIFLQGLFYIKNHFSYKDSS
jgi:hypothetical protein